ncbi:MAG: hypothetical protein JXO72_08520 [Vicinamibacteria bacterium]|nr:hypothetical protein [Vicinamibacteria bacterium]
MARLGALILSATLSGIPRLFQRAVLSLRTRLPYVAVTSGDPALHDFTMELAKAIDRHIHALAEQRWDDTLIVEVHRLSQVEALDGTSPSEAVSVTLRAHDRIRPLILHYPSNMRHNAIEALMRRLSAQSPKPN